MKHLKLYEEFGGGTHFYRLTLGSVHYEDKKELQNWESVFYVLQKSDPSAEIIKSKSGQVFLNLDLGWEESMMNNKAIETFFKSSMEKSEVESIILSAYKNMGMQISRRYSLSEVDEKSLPQ